MDRARVAALGGDRTLLRGLGVGGFALSASPSGASPRAPAPMPPMLIMRFCIPRLGGPLLGEPCSPFSEGLLPALEPRLLRLRALLPEGVVAMFG